MSESITSHLSTRIRELYEHELDHQVSAINYHLFDQTLILILEGTVTPPEQLLTRISQKDLARQVRDVLDRLVQPQIRTLIEEVMNVEVVDFLSDTAIESGRTGAIAIFEFRPNLPPQTDRQSTSAPGSA
ncbi:MAG: DUF2294 domain-containing protein [Chloroflexaceae bacterium]|nr:DUF2294 domain-containing protein [Chloroflexaceae bacterium]